MEHARNDKGECCGEGRLASLGRAQYTGLCGGLGGAVEWGRCSSVMDPCPLAVFNLQVCSDRCMQRTPALPSGAAQQTSMSSGRAVQLWGEHLRKARRHKGNMPARQHRTSAPAGAEQARTSAQGCASFPRGLARQYSCMRTALHSVHQSESQQC